MIYLISNTSYKKEVCSAAKSIFGKDPTCLNLAGKDLPGTGDNADFLKELAISTTGSFHEPSRLIIFTHHIDVKEAIFNRYGKDEEVDIWMSPPFPEAVEPDDNVMVFNPFIFDDVLKKILKEKPFTKVSMNLPDVSFTTDEHLAFLETILYASGYNKIEYSWHDPHRAGFRAGVMAKIKADEGHEIHKNFTVGGCHFPPYGLTVGENGRFGLFDITEKGFALCFSNPVTITDNDLKNGKKREIVPV